MKTFAYMAFVAAAAAGLYIWYGRTPPARAPESAPAAQSIEPSRPTGASGTDESAPNATFEHFFRTLSKSEQACITQKIGAARIGAWIANPDLEPTSAEADTLDLCVKN